jgi:hypothetical protein
MKRSQRERQHHSQFSRYQRKTPLDLEGPKSTAFLQSIAAIKITLEHLLSFEAFTLCVVSTLSVLLFALYEINEHRLAANVSWTVISFVIVFPLTSSLESAYRRRERALEFVAQFKGSLVNYFYGHRDWDWYAPAHLETSELRERGGAGEGGEGGGGGGGGVHGVRGDDGSSNNGNDSNSNGHLRERGRMLVPEKHVEKVREVIIDLVSSCRDVLCMQSAHRLMHLTTKKGKEQKMRAMKVHMRLCDDVLANFNKLSMCTEELKYVGFPGNEASRLRQYVYHCMTAWENLRLIKIHRTPIATRAFARVYIFVHPIFWGPYYALLISEMLQDNSSDNNNVSAGPSLSTKIWVIAYACLLSCLSSLAMDGLFTVRYRLEDPFASRITLNDDDLITKENAAGENNNNTEGDINNNKDVELGATLNEFMDEKRWEINSSHFRYSSIDQINVHGEFGEICRAICSDFKNDTPNACGGGPPKEVWKRPKVSMLDKIKVETFGSLKRNS